MNELGPPCVDFFLTKRIGHIAVGGAPVGSEMLVSLTGTSPAQDSKPKAYLEIGGAPVADVPIESPSTTGTSPMPANGEQGHGQDPTSIVDGSTGTSPALDAKPKAVDTAPVGRIGTPITRNSDGDDHENGNGAPTAVGGHTGTPNSKQSKQTEPAAVAAGSTGTSPKQGDNDVVEKKSDDPVDGGVAIDDKIAAPSTQSLGRQQNDPVSDAPLKDKSGHASDESSASSSSSSSGASSRRSSGEQVDGGGDVTVPLVDMSTGEEQNGGDSTPTLDERRGIPPPQGLDPIAGQDDTAAAAVDGNSRDIPARADGKGDDVASVVSDDATLVNEDSEPVAKGSSRAPAAEGSNHKPKTEQPKVPAIVVNGANGTPPLLSPRQFAGNEVHFGSDEDGSTGTSSILTPAGSSARSSQEDGDGTAPAVAGSTGTAAAQESTSMTGQQNEPVAVESGSTAAPAVQSSVAPGTAAVGLAVDETGGGESPSSSSPGTPSTRSPGVGGNGDDSALVKDGSTGSYPKYSLPTSGLGYRPHAFTSGHAATPLAQHSGNGVEPGGNFDIFADKSTGSSWAPSPGASSTQGSGKQTNGGDPAGSTGTSPVLYILPTSGVGGSPAAATSGAAETPLAQHSGDGVKPEVHIVTVDDKGTGSSSAPPLEPSSTQSSGKPTNGGDPAVAGSTGTSPAQASKPTAGQTGGDVASEKTATSSANGIEEVAPTKAGTSSGKQKATNDIKTSAATHGRTTRAGRKSTASTVNAAAPAPRRSYVPSAALRAHMPEMHDGLSYLAQYPEDVPQTYYS